jgi:hypothetical protein
MFKLSFRLPFTSSTFAKTLGLVLTLALPTVTFANPFGMGASVHGYAQAVGTVLASCSDSGTSAACSATATGILLGNPVTAFVTLRGSADYGGSVFVDATAYSPYGNFQVEANSGFSDTLTIFGGSGNGYISYLVDGTIINIADFGGSGFLINGQGLSAMGSENAHFSFHYQTAFAEFTFGVPFGIGMSAFASTGAGFGGFGEGLAEANIDGITILDQNQEPFTDYTIESASGATYPLPEPSSVVLLGTLAALLGGMSYKKIRR